MGYLSDVWINFIVTAYNKRKITCLTNADDSFFVFVVEKRVILKLVSTTAVTLWY